EFSVIVELTAIGVHNLRGATGAVQRDTDDGWLGITVVIQFRWLEEISAICAVACFNPADASESIPAQIALRPRLLGDELCICIGTQRLRVDVGFFYQVFRPISQAVSSTPGSVDINLRDFRGSDERHFFWDGLQSTRGQAPTVRDSIKEYSTNQDH